MQIPFAPRQDDTSGAPPSTLTNCYIEESPASLKQLGFPYIVRRGYGLASVYSEGVAGTASGRGLYYTKGAAGDRLLGVWGQTLLAFTSAYAAATLSTSLTSGTERVKFIANENDVAILSGGVLWIYDVSAGTVTQVTDPDLVTLADMTYLNDYLVGIEAGTGRIVWALTDWTDWDALDFLTAEEQPDDLVGVLAWRERILAFGRETIEELQPSGDADNPFTAIGAMMIEKGCIARDSIVTADNAPYFVGDDRIIFRLEGAPRRISTHEVEAALEALDDAAAAGIEANVWTERGHTFIGWDIPGYGTWAYDAATGEGHKRATYDEDFWRPRTMTRAFGKTVAQGRVTGTLTDGGLFELDADVMADGSLPLVRTQTAFIPVGMGRPTVDDVSLLGTPGVGLDGEGQGTDPQMMHRWSDDRGKSWSNEVWRPIGAIGRHGDRITWRRCGRSMSPGRTLEFSLSDPVDFSPFGVVVNVGQP